MKKIIALILATIMVMLSVAACGGTGNAKTTGATQGTTTQATTTTEYVAPIPDPVDVVVYYPMGENPVAINISTNESAGKLTLAEGAEFELVQGNFYVATYYNGESTAKANLGAALSNTNISIGLTNKRSDKAPSNQGAVNGGSNNGNWWRNVGQKKYNMNTFMDVAAMNTAMGEYSTLGHFGTLTVTEIVGGDIYFESNNASVGEIGASDMKVQFAYVAYDGTVIKTATSKEAKTPVANQCDLLRYANDIANAWELGFTAASWQGFLDYYGYTGAKNMCTCEKCNGTIDLQTHWLNEWNPNHVAVNYASALTKLADLDPAKEAEYKTTFDAAQKAFDDAVAANADVAALRAKAEAEGAADADKTAYTNAIAADTNLKALNDALTTAKANYDNVANYNKLASLYEKFCKAYEEAADLVLWDPEDVENSYLYKQLTADGVDLATLKPTLTYYYDAATETYTIYVTSATDANVVVRWPGKNGD